MARRRGFRRYVQYQKQMAALELQAMHVWQTKLSKRMRHIMPTTEDLVVKLNGAKFCTKFFSKIDLRSGYNQIKIKKKSRYITTFCTPIGIFQYLRLNMGTSASSEIFQKIIEQTLGGLKGCLNLSDDIIVFSMTQQEHDDNLNKVLKRLSDSGLTITKRKCKFNKTQIDFFGMRFSAAGISIQDDKLSALINATNPNTPSEVHSFLRTSKLRGTVSFQISQQLSIH